MIKIQKRMIPFTAAIFDMDGVIVDNHNYHVKAWAEFCKKYSIPFEENSFRSKYFGKNNQDILSSLMNYQLTPYQRESLGEEKEDIYRRIYQGYITPVKGFKPFILSLREKGYKTAVATSAPTSNLDFVLDNLRIRHLFDIVVDASGITMGKPDPEIYLKAARLLDIAPARCVVFEDSISGIKSAHSAGMQVIALVTTHKTEELPKTYLQINNFTELISSKF